MNLKTAQKRLKKAKKAYNKNASTENLDALNTAHDNLQSAKKALADSKKVAKPNAKLQNLPKKAIPVEKPLPVTVLDPAFAAEMIRQVCKKSGDTLTAPQAIAALRKQLAK